MKFDDFLKDRDSFALVQKPNQNLPEGVTKEVLWDLWDIVVKKGENLYSPKIGIQMCHGQVALEASDFRNNGVGGRAGLTVFYYEKGKRFQSTGSAGACLFNLANGMLVIWDNRVTLEAAKSFVADVDEFHCEQNGVRQQERPLFDFWRDWKFWGRRVVFVPRPAVPRPLWMIRMDFEKDAEAGTN